MATKETMKSPFELRMDMLAMSKDMLEKQFELTREYTMKSWEAAVEAAKAAQKALPEMPTIAAYPTFDDMMKLAEKMNVFVSGK